MAMLMRGNFIFVWLALASAASAFLVWGRASADRQLTTFDEINVQRLNIIEPDGKPRVIIASRARMSNMYWHGKEYQHRSNGAGGFLFFNDDGTEAGGMGFGNDTQDNQYGATSNLNFDQFEQDNTLQFIYTDQNGARTAGLRVKDRPNESLFPAIELVDKLARASSDSEREKLQAQLKQLEKKYVGGTAERFFAGKQLDDSTVRLSDKQGRARLVLKVDGKGEPSVEFRDESGKVTSRIAGTQQR